MSSHEASVQKFYGNSLSSTSDLEISACVLSCPSAPSSKARQALRLVHPDVKAKYYGCGAALPEAVEGCRVVDLGCGAGLDVFVLSSLVGADGFVTGVDMTPQQLQVARQHVDYHAEVYGFEKPNVAFVEGRLESLDSAGIASASIDVVISNCVISLVEDKAKALAEAFRVLKDGGEFFFCDVYADREVPDSFAKDNELWVLGFGGALHWRRLHELAASVGFSAPRLVKVKKYDAENAEVASKIDGVSYVAATYKIFKTKAPIDAPAFRVTYGGNITDHEEKFLFDAENTFERAKPRLVDAMVAAILMSSRFNSKFDFEEDKEAKVMKRKPQNPFLLLD